LLRQIAFALILTSTATPAQQPTLQTAPNIPFDSIPGFLNWPVQKLILHPERQ
jgi:hypothetical protein